MLYNVTFIIISSKKLTLKSYENCSIRIKYKSITNLSLKYIMRFLILLKQIKLTKILIDQSISTLNTLL